MKKVVINGLGTICASVIDQISNLQLIGLVNDELEIGSTQGDFKKIPVNISPAFFVMAGIIGFTMVLARFPSKLLVLQRFWQGLGGGGRDPVRRRRKRNKWRAGQAHAQGGRWAVEVCGMRWSGGGVGKEAKRLKQVIRIRNPCRLQNLNWFR